MVKLLKLLLAYKFKEPKPSQTKGGFTLIELLVGLVLALLVILPLLGFMVNILSSDRQEQAKANSAQEIQTALDYIARDVEQAIYIYDAHGLSKIQASLPTPANSVPVLVFWKRQFVPNVIPTAQGNDDAFVYALVAYYVRTLPTAECTKPTSTVSCTAQITRTLIKNVAKDRSNEPIDNDERAQGSPGFVMFDPKVSSSVEEIMNAWPPTGTDIDRVAGNIQDNTPEVLIDYIDQTAVTGDPKLCPSIQRSTVPPGIADASAYDTANYQQVPKPTSTIGFFACVDVEKTSAQIFMRGNALARLRPKSNPPTYVESQAAYFPRASIQVKGRGLVTVKQGEE
ncbi:MAG: hormogonium polysaccharide secretion pseudopilin HpsC [Cyanobacteriota bacterium]